MNTRTLVIVFGAITPAFAAPPASHVNLVGCPVIRDTSTVPCWLVRHEGELYYLGIQTDISSPWFPPYQGHKILVEGVVSGEPRICGGIVLKPVNTSTLPEMDPSCNEFLPATPEYEVPFAPRGPGPSKRNLAYAAPATPPRPVQPEEPKPPFKQREFTIPYEFDAPFVTGRTSRVMQQAVMYARQIDAHHIEVTGFRGSVQLSDGKLFVEKDGIARQRAEQVGQLLHEVGVATDKLVVNWIEKPAKATGDEDFKQRRVTMTVKP